MAHTSPSAPQLSPQSVTQQNSAQKWLTRSAIIIGVFLVVLFVLPLLVTAISYTNLLNSPAPNATVTVSQMQALANQAHQQLQQSNNLLNLVTSFATVMAIVLAILTVIAVGLGALGIITNNGFRDLEDKWRQNLASVANLQQQTEEKGKTIDKLGEDMIDKQQYIEKLHDDITLKQQNIGELQRTLRALNDEMKDQLEKVKKDFEKTNRALTQLILGNQLLELGRREEALEYYEKAHALVPDDPQISYALGRIYSGLKAYDKAITLDPQFHQAHMELGLAYRRRGNQKFEEAELVSDEKKQKTLYAHASADYQQAIQHLENALRLRPEYEDALATLGGLYRRLGDYEHNAQDYRLALESYEKATRADPNSSYALGNFASLSWFFGNQQQAMIAFARNKEIATERIEKKINPAEIYWDYYDLALAQLVLGELEDAKKTYTIAIEKTPGLVEFEGVLSNLNLLSKAQNPIPGLEEIIKMVKEAEKAKSQVYM